MPRQKHDGVTCRKRIPMSGRVYNTSAQEIRNIKRRDAAFKDSQQMTFFRNENTGETSTKLNTYKYVNIQRKGIDPFTMTTCPFCLALNQFSRFLISGKKGINRGSGKCPNCGLGMKLETLQKMQEWTKKGNSSGVIFYAEWVYEYRSSGFWQKIHAYFPEWKKYLSMMGWTKEFWEKYKALKEENNYDKDWEAYQSQQPGED